MSVPPQSLVLVEEKLVDLSTQPLSAIVELQRASVSCPRCAEELSVALSSAGPGASGARSRRAPSQGSEEGGIEAKHSVKSLQDHDPATRISWACRAHLIDRLAEIFPSALVERDVELRAELDRPLLAEALVLSSLGARLPVIYVGGGRPRDWTEIEPLDERITERGMRALWLLSGERLASTRGGLPEGTALRSVALGQTEVGLLSIGRPLLYHGPNPHKLYRVFVPTKLAQRVVSSGLRALGTIKLPVRCYNLTQLRVRSGAWSLWSPFDTPLPEPPELPKRVQKRLADAEEAQRVQAQADSTSPAS